MWPNKNNSEQVRIAELEAELAALRAAIDKLAHMSHDVRTPMNAIVGLTDILMMKAHSPERQKEFLETMQESARQLALSMDGLFEVISEINK